MFFPAVTAVYVGLICMVVSLVMSTALLRDPHLPMPLAIVGAGLFIGGSIRRS